jgi:hypothetical protein
VDRAEGREDLCRAVLRAGVGAPREFSSKFFKRIKKAILDGDSRIRSAGIWATAYSRWPVFVPLLTDVSQQDPVESLQRDARIILNHYAE